MDNPALFEGKEYDPCDLALEFVKVCYEYPVTAVIARGILVKMILPLFVNSIQFYHCITLCITLYSVQGSEI